MSGAAALWATMLCALVASPQAVDFDAEIVPALTQAGCNAGACHGAAAGRGGLRLSLFGSDPASDYRSLVREAEGRRIHLVRPEKSLLLTKPLEKIPHGGGTIFEEDSPTAELLRRWVVQGAQRIESPQLLSIRVLPRETFAAEIDEPQEIHVQALFAGGISRDVTHAVKMQADDPSGVRIDGPSSADPRLRVTSLRPGRQLVTVRFREQVLPITMLVPFDADKAHHDPAHFTEQLNGPSFIDQAIDDRLQELGLVAAEEADDATWLRRVRIDLTGRLPLPTECKEFQKDTSAEKRRRKIDELMSSEEFDEMLTLRFARWLRIVGNPQTPKATATYAKWLREAVRDRRSFDSMARELLTSTGNTEEVGPANFSLSAPDARKHAELVSSVFMGVRLQCANCHNHPLDRWTQDDYHGLAALFAGVARESRVQFKLGKELTHPKTGEAAIPRLPDGTIVNNDRATPTAVAEWLFDGQNRMVARSAVNRVWQWLMGRGLVDAVDDLRVTNPASHPELLDALADDLMSHGYDLRRTMRLIVSSRAYGRSSHSMDSVESSSARDQWYATAMPKAMPPEVLLDAINDVLSIDSDAARDLNSGERPRAVRDMIDGGAVSTELDLLGRCSRGANCSTAEGTADLSPAAKLNWVNGDLINAQLSSMNGRLHTLASQGKSMTEILDDFSLRALSRPLNADRLRAYQSEYDSLPSDQRLPWLEDAIWALLSSDAFLRNR